MSWREDAKIPISVSEDGTLKGWDMSQGRNLRTAQIGGGAQSVAIAHDNRMLVTGRDRKVRLLDANGGQTREFVGLTDIGLKTAFTHDMARVLAGDWSGTVYVWDTKDGKLLGKLSTNPK